MDRLSFATVADRLHVGDGAQHVHVDPPLVKVSLTEQFNVRGLEVLREIKQSDYYRVETSHISSPQCLGNTFL